MKFFGTLALSLTVLFATSFAQAGESCSIQAEAPQILRELQAKVAAELSRAIFMKRIEVDAEKSRLGLPTLSVEHRDGDEDTSSYTSYTFSFGNLNIVTKRGNILTGGEIALRASEPYKTPVYDNEGVLTGQECFAFFGLVGGDLVLKNAKTGQEVLRIRSGNFSYTYRLKP